MNKRSTLGVRPHHSLDNIKNYINPIFNETQPPDVLRNMNNTIVFQPFDLYKHPNHLGQSPAHTNYPHFKPDKNGVWYFKNKDDYNV